MSCVAPLEYGLGFENRVFEGGGGVGAHVTLPFISLHGAGDAGAIGRLSTTDHSIVLDLKGRELGCPRGGVGCGAGKRATLLCSSLLPPPPFLPCLRAGHLYSGVFLPCNSFVVIGISGSEAKVGRLCSRVLHQWLQRVP